jgi:hypothetical protein
MRSRGRLKALIVRARRALIVWPTMVAYVVMALGIPIPIRAAQDPSRLLPVQSGGCHCAKCDHGKKKCCCCCAVESKDQVPSQSGTVSSTPPSSPQTHPGNADDGKVTVWQLYVTAPSCGEQATLWLMNNPASVVPAPLTWQVALVPFGWVQPIDCTATTFTISPPSPPPRA